MEGIESTASVYAETKSEYTKQLILFMSPVFHRFFIGSLSQAMTEEPNQKRQLWKFQELLSQVPEWNVDKVHRETTKLIGEIQCDYLEDLVTAVFIAHTKVLAAIRIGNKNKRLQITIPKLDHFLHRSLSECSRILWSYAYLFNNEQSPIEKQKNHRQIENHIQEGIGQAIRGLLPVKNILKDSLPDHDDKDEDEDDEDDKTEEKPIEVVEEKLPEEKPIEEPSVQKVEEAYVEKPIEEKPAEKPIEVLEEKPIDSPLEEVLEKVLEEKPIENSLEEKPAPTFYVDTEPAVRFTNFNQVIKEENGKTSIDFVETNHNEDEDEDIHFMDDEAGELSDIEDLTEYPPEPLAGDDFEQL